jgi:hypothetical protein
VKANQNASALKAPNPSRIVPMVIIGGLVAGICLIGFVPVAGLSIAWIADRRETKPVEPGPLLAERPDPVPAPIEKKPLPDAPVDEPKIEIKLVKKARPDNPIFKPPPAIDPKIQEALDKGAAHLKRRILEKNGPSSIDRRYPDDAPVGGVALAGLALLETNVPPDDPAIQQALATVRDAGPRLKLVYAIGSVLFFLNRLDEAQPLNGSDRQLARSLALRLMAGQCADGCWTYVNMPLGVDAEADLVQRLGTNSYRPTRTTGGKGYTSHSMTQFALLSLWGSRRHDVVVHASVFAAATHFHESQTPEGTWEYRDFKSTPLPVGKKTPIGLRRSDSNTCAGLIALAMEKTMRRDKKFHLAGFAMPPRGCSFGRSMQEGAWTPDGRHRPIADRCAPGRQYRHHLQGRRMGRLLLPLVSGTCSRHL